MAIDDLEDWVSSGAHWRLVDLSNAPTVVDMCSRGGEALECVASSAPAGIGYLRTGHCGLG